MAAGTQQAEKRYLENCVLGHVESYTVPTTGSRCNLMCCAASIWLSFLVTKETIKEQTSLSSSLEPVLLD